MIKVITDEWESWQDICRELSILKIDINKEDKLTKAIRVWGDKLAILRIDQG